MIVAVAKLVANHLTTMNHQNHVASFDGAFRASIAATRSLSQVHPCASLPMQVCNSQKMLELRFQIPTWKWISYPFITYNPRTADISIAYRVWGL